MKKIQFNDETVAEINNYIREGHTIKETCNRFTIKQDTLRRVMVEHNIEPYYSEKRNGIDYNNISQDKKDLIYKLYSTTEMSMYDIRQEVSLPDYVIQLILREKYSQEEIDKHKSKIYRKSKLGDKNPCYGKYGEEHPNYKGLISDGNGYLMILKPDWYTGRKNSKHVFYHHVVMCENLGITEIPKGFVVHHIDGNKQNNDISNLCLLTISAHGKIHHQLNKV